MLKIKFIFPRHHNRVHRNNRTTANSIATINSVASGEMGSSMNATTETGTVYDATTGQVCDLRWTFFDFWIINQQFQQSFFFIIFSIWFSQIENFLFFNKYYFFLKWIVFSKTIFQIFNGKKTKKFFIWKVSNREKKIYKETWLLKLQIRFRSTTIEWRTNSITDANGSN